LTQIHKTSTASLVRKKESKIVMLDYQKNFENAGNHLFLIILSTNPTENHYACSAAMLLKRSSLEKVKGKSSFRNP